MGELYTSEEREKSILDDTPGHFKFDPDKTLPGAEINPNSIWSQPGYAGAVVREYQDEINAAAEKYGIDPDLLSTIIYYEINIGKTKDSLETMLGVNSSQLPANVQPRWAALLGYQPDDILDPKKNIEIGAKLLSEIIERLPEGTPAAWASLYNTLSADEIRSYGLTVQDYMIEKPWLQIPDGVTYPSYTPMGDTDGLIRLWTH